MVFVPDGSRLEAALPVKVGTTAHRMLTPGIAAGFAGGLGRTTAVPGVEIVGPLPQELRQTIVYGATVFQGSTRQEANKAFFAFMRSFAARQVLHHTGLDPV